MRDKNEVMRFGNSCDQHVVRANEFTSAGQLGTDRRVAIGGSIVEREEYERFEELHYDDATSEAWIASLRSQ